MRLIDADSLILNMDKGMQGTAREYLKFFHMAVNDEPTAYDVENPWILCSKKLPEEPEEIPTEDEPVEEMMLDGKFKEYIVAIWGAYESTTLYYIGNNEWYDGISGTYYKVIAWQPMPEVYKGLDR